jgi:hypothetical protein
MSVQDSLGWVLSMIDQLGLRGIITAGWVLVLVVSGVSLLLSRLSDR